MGDKTGIAWTDATWNPLRGCSRVSKGCMNCYAETVAARFSGPGMPYEGLARFVSRGHPDVEGSTDPQREARWTGEVRLVEKALVLPLRWTRPRKIFVNSMSDLFHERVPREWVAGILGVIARARQHTFQVLTKRPERMRRLMSSIDPAEALACMSVLNPETCKRPIGADEVKLIATNWPPPNLGLGVSVEDADQRERIDVLRHVPAARRFISFEPLLGDLRDMDLRGIHWAIFGGESGPCARPCHVGWIGSGMATCRYYGLAVFVKQLGSHVEACDIIDAMDFFPGEVSLSPGSLAFCARVRLRDRKGADPAEWPQELRVQEFPR